MPTTRPQTQTQTQTQTGKRHGGGPQPGRPRATAGPTKCYRLEQVAALFGVNKSTVRRWVQAGTFPPPLSVTGRVFLWPKPVIDAVLAGRMDFEK
jgi:predicted DNA-binding transcriptional regulator AlpA